MRVTVVALGALVAMDACVPSAMPPSNAKADVPMATSVAAVDAGAGDGGDGGPVPEPAALDTLAQQATSVAAGMREVTRGELAGNATGATRLIARADDRDVCVRVVVSARPAVRAWLTDTRGDTLAEMRDAGDGALGARGPVCVRKGDAVSLRVESSGAFVVRFVGWESP